MFTDGAVDPLTFFRSTYRNFPLFL